jgi:hypothetical protein
MAIGLKVKTNRQKDYALFKQETLETEYLKTGAKKPVTFHKIPLKNDVALKFLKENMWFHVCPIQLNELILLNDTSYSC